MESLLEVKGLNVSVRTIAGNMNITDNVSFGVYEKEILGIAGESGCGKSTVVETVLNLIVAPRYIESGQVLLKGRDLLTLSPRDLQNVRWKEVAYVPQGSMNTLNPVLKIEEQIVDAIICHSKLSKAQAKEAAVAALRSVGMSPDVARMYPHELSGGMRQRVCIGLSTALKPAVILADEPVTALDVVMQRLNLETLARLRDQDGITVVMVTHDMACHAEICDRVCVMYAGRVAEIGETRTLFAEPLHPYTQGLLRAVPSIQNRHSESIPGIAPSPTAWPKGCRFHPRCKQAMEICSREVPPLREIRPKRLVACHLYNAEGGARNG
ncbi:MAG: ABC transporter ATP-binding protein [Spirochaetia bacterium]|jgi:peptide/nickel transport system ATP-binding protein